MSHKPDLTSPKLGIPALPHTGKVLSFSWSSAASVVTQAPLQLLLWQRTPGSNMESYTIVCSKSWGRVWEKSMEKDYQFILAIVTHSQFIRRWRQTTWWLLVIQLRDFSTSCAYLVHIVGADGCPVVVVQWLSGSVHKPGVLGSILSDCVPFHFPLFLS